MDVKKHIYVAIDLKSFYASVECVERRLDPLRTNLVVADRNRTEKTICLAVSPSLKAYGISGRARLFEVVQKVKEVNAGRKLSAPGGVFEGESYDDEVLKASPGLSVSYITALPRMALYMKYSTDIYNIYLKYVAPEDIHVYSIDEVFMDFGSYLEAYRMSARELTKKIIQEILQVTGITAAAGIGTNLYLCKIAMDIVAKHVALDEDGVKIAQLDEKTYRKLLWNHRPLTDFWRIGRGYAKKLEENGLFTMGDVARCSLGEPTDFYNEDLLYRLFGINAELLIDHAWGWEPCTIADVKAYKPESSSIGSGQVLQHPYSFEKGKLIVREMTDLMVLDLVDKGFVTDQIVLTVGYDRENLVDPESRKRYKGPVTTDHYGRRVPKPAHGTINLESQTSSTKLITNAVMELYERIVDKHLLIRRVYVTANRVEEESRAERNYNFEQLDLFTDYNALQRQKEAEKAELEREKKYKKPCWISKRSLGKMPFLRE